MRIQKSLCTVATLCAMLAVVVLTSCEKAIIPDDEAIGTADGNLTVSVYQIEQMPFASMTRGSEVLDSETRAAATRAAVTDYCNRLNFAIYEMDGSRVKQVNQTSDKVGFGTASFSLEEGEYQLVVLAHSSNGNPTMTNPLKIQFTNSTGYTDTFLYYTTVAVTDEHQTLSVSLERIVSMCRFVMNDAIPAGVSKLEFYYTGGSGTFSAATGLGNVNSKQKMTFSVEQSGKAERSVTAGDIGTQYDLYTFLHQQDDDITLTVTAYDATDNVLYEREFDVPMTRRKITRLSGDFFTGDPSASGDVGVTISINGDWDGQTDVTY